LTTERKPTANSRFAKAGVSCFYNSLVQVSSSVFQLNPERFRDAENLPQRKAENRWMQS
jgi:hypothetical protein